MKTAVLTTTDLLRRKAASFAAQLPRVDRRYAVVAVLAAPVVFLGPYVVPFMLALLLFGAVVAAFVSLALRAGWRHWQAALVPLAMTPFVGLVGPVEQLSNWMQILAHLFPPTYIIEGIRTLIAFGAFDAAAFVASVLLSGVYLFFIYLWVGAAAGGKALYGTLQMID